MLLAGYRVNAHLSTVALQVGMGGDATDTHLFTVALQVAMESDVTSGLQS